MAKVHRTGSSVETERQKLLDVLDKASDHLNMAELLNQDGRIKFNVHPYGETEFDDKDTLLDRIAKGELSSDMTIYENTREKDIPFSVGNLGILDFGYSFETEDWENDILTDEEEDRINDSVAHILKDYGLIVHHDDGPQGFGHYKPWYVDGKTPISLDYGLDEINDLHPYSALRTKQGPCSCAEHASLDIYEDDFIVMECNKCGRTATFKQEGPYAGPRRNPVSKKTGKTIGLIGGAIVAAFVAKKVLD